MFILWTRTDSIPLNVENTFFYVNNVSSIEAQQSLSSVMKDVGKAERTFGIDITIILSMADINYHKMTNMYSEGTLSSLFLASLARGRHAAPSA